MLTKQDSEAYSVKMSLIALRQILRPPTLITLGRLLHTRVGQFDVSLPVEKALTPPSSWFKDQAFHDLDKKAIFGQEWICVGHVGQVNASGKFFSGSVAKEPYLVVNDGSEIKAFYNVCRHHAAQLTPDGTEGCTNKFECPYHGWTYSTSGRLTKATRLKGIQDFSAKNFGLMPIAVDLWGPLIFINLNSHKKAVKGELENYFTPVKEAIENETGGTFEKGLRFVKRVTYDMDCNWKVFVDNYLDGGYHVSYLHKDLASGLDIDSYKTEVGPRFSLQKVKGSNGSEHQDRLGQNAIYAFLFPNLMINRYGPWMDTNVVIPLGPNTSRVTYDYFIEESKWDSFGSEVERDKYVAECLRNSDQVQQEDGYICRAVQAGLESSGYDVGRYAPGVELADHRFHLLLAEKYQEHINSV